MNTRDKPNYNLISKYRTVLMGIAIILIMFCHMDVAQGNNGVHVTSVARALHILTVGVDIFMFLSGFGLFYSYKKYKQSYMAFEKKRLLRILPAYFIIGGGTYAIYDLLMHHLGIYRFFSDVTFLSWIKEGSTKYWYILAIVLFYLVFPALFQFVYSGKHELLKTIVFSGCWWVAEEILSEQIPAIGNLRIALARLPIFVIGLYCGHLSEKKREPEKKTIVFWLVFGFLLFIVMKLPALKTVAEYFYYPTRAALAISIMILVIGLLELLEKNMEKMNHFFITILEWFGGLTLELYLLHQSYMILFDSPYKYYTYPIAAFVLPTITAGAIYAVRRMNRKENAA